MYVTVLRGRKEPAFEIRYTAVVPYIKGVSEALRRCLQQLSRHAHCFQVQHNTYVTLSAIQGRCGTVRTRWTSHKIPRECCKVFIGEKGNRWILERNTAEMHGSHELRPQQPQNMLIRPETICFGTRLKFVDHVPHWYVQRAKEAIHIRLHPNNINRDNGIGIPEAGPMIKQHISQMNAQRTSDGTASSQKNENRKAPITTTVILTMIHGQWTPSNDKDRSVAVETSRSTSKWSENLCPHLVIVTTY